MLASFFRTQYHHLGLMSKSKELVPDIVTNAGNRFKTVYKTTLADDGHIVLTPDGSTDLYAEIQSHRDSVELSALIERYKLGDTTALNRTAGVYADVSKMPKTYREVLQTVIDGENLFASLPLEVRDKFGNDFNRWFSAGMPVEFAKNDGSAPPANADFHDKMQVKDGELSNE